MQRTWHIRDRYMKFITVNDTITADKDSLETATISILQSILSAHVNQAKLKEALEVMAVESVQQCLQKGAFGDWFIQIVQFTCQMLNMGSFVKKMLSRVIKMELRDSLCVDASSKSAWRHDLSMLMALCISKQNDLANIEHHIGLLIDEIVVELR